MTQAWARVPLAGSPAEPEFEPGPEVSRISLAWWDPEEEEGRRDPILVRYGSTVRTIVVVWPTDPSGLVQVESVRRGEVLVRTWTVGPLLDRLREVSRDFRLDLHDLLVTRGTVYPTRDTLRTLPMDLDLDRRVLSHSRGLSVV